MPSCFAKTSSTSRGQVDINIGKGCRQIEGRSFSSFVLGCACLCLNLSRTYTFHCRRKRQAVFEMVGLSCQCSVLVGSEFDSYSAGPEFDSRRPKKALLCRDGIMTDWSLAQGKNYIRIHGVGNL